MNELIKIGIIGSGNMGKNHLKKIPFLENTKLAFILDKNILEAKKLGNEYNVPAFGIDEIDKAIKLADAVVISTPTSTHEEIIYKAARETSNIFVEKPIAENKEQSKRIHEYCEEKNIHIQVGFIERFNPSFQKFEEILNKYQQLNHLNFRRENTGSQRIKDVDVVTDLMIHDIDLAIKINGPIKSISAHGIVSKNTIDSASALIEHKNGKISQLKASRISQENHRLITATCKDMSIHCDLLNKNITIIRKFGNPEIHTEYNGLQMQEGIEIPKEDALLCELQTFISNCRRTKNHTPAPSSLEGLSAAEAAETIIKKIKDNQNTNSFTYTKPTTTNT